MEVYMKARKLHDFFIFAQKYTLESMIKMVSFWAYDIYRNPDINMGGFSGKRFYQSKTYPVMLVQTWLIDLVYDLIKYNRYGQSSISQHEALKLIGLYNDYKDDTDHTPYNKKDIFLYLYGFFGEQCRFQNNSFLEEFAREKYILETVSNYPEANACGINFKDEFEQETSFSPDVYSANIFTIFSVFYSMTTGGTKREIIKYFKSSPINGNDIADIIDENSISIENIRNHPLGRQSLYIKPIIKFEEKYISVNPYLLLALFANSNYWILRNKYYKLKSQKFINAFGIYFEKYVEELLGRCLSENEYMKVPECNVQKRADWKLNVAGFNILVEQKSTLPVLGIKQNQPDMNAIKKYIVTSWGEAVEQLSETEAYYTINCIKIILVYDEYFKAESLEELFKLRTDLQNDGNYWLLNIREFEMLLMLYRKDTELFKKVMKEKIEAEITFSRNGRELAFFLEKYNIKCNEYLTEFGIYNETKRIRQYYINK